MHPINDLDKLRESVRHRLSAERFWHTIGVEDVSYELGKVFLPDKVEWLRAAALLHDIAKELSEPDQLSLVAGLGIVLSDEDLDTPATLHAFAAPGIIERDYPFYATREIMCAVYRHTLGAPRMSLFDKIIFIADYIEPSREYSSCKEVREFLFDALRESSIDNVKALNRAVFMAIEFTVISLENRGKRVHSRAIDTRNSLLPYI